MTNTAADHMEEAGHDYYALLEGKIPTQRMDVPLFSSVTGKAISDPEQLGPSYWRQNLESPVLFNSAVRTCLDQMPHENVFLEIGPHSALAGPLRQIFKAVEIPKPPTYVPSLVRGKDSTRSLLTTVGQMYSLAVPLNFEAVTPGRVVLTGLPTYPWHHEKTYWSESRVSREWRMRRFPRHELLGSRVLEGNELEPSWRNILRLEDVPWVQDHKIIDDIVFPAAGYVCMAGEAIRQLTGTQDFTLRNVLIKTALVLHDGAETEMMTSLRPVRLTDSFESDWYEFAVSSYNGTSWTKHCTGQARAGGGPQQWAEGIEILPREVPVASWYAAMKRLGLNYGPSFQGLTAISAGPNTGTSAATLSDHARSEDSSYQIHPTTIDLCLQLFTVGMAEGTIRRLQKLCVPTEFEELYIRQGAPDMRARVIASASKKGMINGEAIALVGNEVALQLKGGKFSPLEDQDSNEDSDPVAAAQLEWKPDIDFMPVDKLMRPYGSVRVDSVRLERLALLCMLETRYQLSQLETKADHLRKFRTWLDVQAERADNGTYTLISDAQDLAFLNHEGRLKAIKTVSVEVERGVGAEIGKTLLRIVEQCKAIFTEQVDSIDILMQDDGLKTLYGIYQDMWDSRKFFDLLGHANPRLRILEIGAGTGGTTSVVLDNLRTEQGVRTYSEYCYTDISAGFFVAAKERFENFQNIEYKVLDISKDPVEQGFEAESYDLIIAANVSLQLPPGHGEAKPIPQVLHATEYIGSTLRNVRKLLHPRGRLLLQELTPSKHENRIIYVVPADLNIALRFFNYIMVRSNVRKVVICVQDTDGSRVSCQAGGSARRMVGRTNHTSHVRDGIPNSRLLVSRGQIPRSLTMTCRIKSTSISYRDLRRLTPISSELHYSAKIAPILSLAKWRLCSLGKASMSTFLPSIRYLPRIRMFFRYWISMNPFLMISHLSD